MLEVVQSRKEYDHALKKRVQWYGCTRSQRGLHWSIWVEYRFLRPIEPVRFNAGVIVTVDRYLDDMVGTFTVGLQALGVRLPGLQQGTLTAHNLQHFLIPVGVCFIINNMLGTEFRGDLELLVWGRCRDYSGPCGNGKLKRRAETKNIGLQITIFESVLHRDASCPENKHIVTSLDRHRTVEGIVCSQSSTSNGSWLGRRKN